MQFLSHKRGSRLYYHPRRPTDLRHQHRLFVRITRVGSFGTRWWRTSWRALLVVISHAVYYFKQMSDWSRGRYRNSVKRSSRPNYYWSVQRRGGMHFTARTPWTMV